MKGKRFFLATYFLVLVLASCAQDQSQNNYIKRYAEIAVREMERTGVPASIKLAQGILESNSGKSTLARKAKNHFGMKCGSVWKGPTYYKEDDDFDENGKLIKSCFRVFDSGEESFIAHSEFLRDPRKKYRYGWLFTDIDPRDYKGWAKGLKKSGYATSPTYAEKLIGIIERADLARFDYMQSDELKVTPPDLSSTDPSDRPTRPGRRDDPVRQIRKILRNNDVRYTTAFQDDTPYDLSLKYDMPVEKILRYNEYLSNANQSIAKGEKVYLQCKKNNYRGKRKFHFIKGNETMFDLSQMYGVKLDKLYKKNRLAKGSEPAPGSKIKIRGRKVYSNEVPPLRDDYLPVNPPPENNVPVRANDVVSFDNEVTPTEVNNRPPSNERTDRPSSISEALDKRKKQKQSNNNSSSNDRPGSISEALNKNNGTNTGNTPSTSTGSTGTSSSSDVFTTPPPSTNVVTHGEIWEERNDVPYSPPPRPTTSTVTNSTGSSNPTITNNPPPVVTNPTSTPTPNTPSTPPSSTRPVTAALYTVQDGDTLYRISKTFDISVNDLKMLNGLTNNTIRKGQQLKVR